MRRLIALVLASTLIVGVAAPAAYAGNAATNVALGLASFAVFNQLIETMLHPRHAYGYSRTVYVTPPPPQVVYAPPPPQVVYMSPPQVVMVQPPPPPAPSVVYYPHGRYELRANSTQYYWVWIPNPPPPPPPPPPALPPPPAAP